MSKQSDNKALVGCVFGIATIFVFTPMSAAMWFGVLSIIQAPTWMWVLFCLILGLVSFDCRVWNRQVTGRGNCGFMNVLLFAKADAVPERRIAEFLSRPKQHVYVHSLLGVEHDPLSKHFDCVRLNLTQLLAIGVTELRLEIEA